MGGSCEKVYKHIGNIGELLMHILFINQYFYPDTASTGQLLTELCESLTGKYRVTVLCGAPSYNPIKRLKVGWPFKREKFQNVRVFRTPSTGFSRNNMISRISNYLSYLIHAFPLALMIDKPDIVIAMTDPPVVGLVAVLMKKLRKIPNVLVVNDLHPDIGIILGKLQNKLVISIMDKITKKTYIRKIGKYAFITKWFSKA